MQPIDPKLQNEVWSRVMGANQPATAADTVSDTVPEQPAETETAPLTDAELLTRMQHEKNDCATYRYLSCKACGCDARTLRQIADDEACHFKKLHAMYFLLTGKCVCLSPEKPDCTACLTDALRARYEGELAAAAQYEADARRWPDMADEFLCMAADETRHSKCVRAMICRRL